jgi:hypothetical protein
MYEAIAIMFIVGVAGSIVLMLWPEDIEDK